MVGIQALLNNLFFILTPIFLYQIFWIDKKKENPKHKKVLLILLTTVIIILCMSFPVKFGTEFLFDLRHVPLILGALYIGFPAALPAFIIIISYRYFLGGDGVYVNFIVVTLILLIVPILKSSYLKLQRKSKVLFSSGLSLVSGLLVVFIVPFTGNISFGEFFVMAIPFVVIQAISMWFVTYLIEEMSYNKKIEERILHTEKLNIISDLSASISHEIRNPLTVTQGFLQMLYRNDLSDEKKKCYINFALSELKRGEMIITDFLSLTKTKAENNASFNVIKELQYVVNILTPYALIHNVDMKMKTFILNENVLVWVGNDYNRFQQSLINLMKNSIEAMPNGGTLKITVRPDEKLVLIQIKDTGIGMSKKELSRLGTPYYTTKEKGTGLGTALIFTTMHSMKGIIDVESEKGKGTTISLRLPIYLPVDENECTTFSIKKEWLKEQPFIE